MQNRFVELLLEERARGKTISPFLQACSRRPNAPAAVPPFCEGQAWPLWRIWSGCGPAGPRPLHLLCPGRGGGPFCRDVPGGCPLGYGGGTAAFWQRRQAGQGFGRLRGADLSTRSQTLEELFLSYYGEEAAK